MLTIVVLTICLLLVPTMTEAQQSVRIPRVGVLVPEFDRPQSQMLRGLRDELQQLGYQEGKNFFIETQNAKGDRGALKPAVTKLVTQKVNVIVTTGTRATLTAKSATSEIPLVFIHPADPVALGFVKSMTRPEGNLTGVAGLALQMTEKRMEILREVYPGVQRVLIFYDANDQFSQENFLFAKQTAVKLGLKVSAHPVKTSEELKISLGRIEKKEGDAIFHVPDNLVEGQADFLFEVARQKRLPTMFHEEKWAIKGAMAAYGPSYYDMGREAARLVDRILKGQKPQDLPIVQANKFDLTINYRTANFINLIPSRDVLKRADKVIR